MAARPRPQPLTPLEMSECRAAFDAMTEEEEDAPLMTATQLRDCLSALGLPVTKSEAKALVYARDSENKGAIGFADFQQIYAAQADTAPPLRGAALAGSEAVRTVVHSPSVSGRLLTRTHAVLSVSMLDPQATGSVELAALADSDGGDALGPTGDGAIDAAELRAFFSGRQHEPTAVDDDKISCASLAAFLRIQAER
ncbi:hypothetical protein P43SY_010032 [Pythium insidiosum]|uniref:EF-hand domain-containing protein n=1 Tax=Pythium insidiosum TaxID=114742 RepID=A0AAD5Q8Q2_PYTIN|nr:hypothetical protein P43SY_010032 [Pythium insidiosum]